MPQCWHCRGSQCGDGSHQNQFVWPFVQGKFSLFNSLKDLCALVGNTVSNPGLQELPLLSLTLTAPVFLCLLSFRCAKLCVAQKRTRTSCAAWSFSTRRWSPGPSLCSWFLLSWGKCSPFPGLFLLWSQERSSHLRGLLHHLFLFLISERFPAVSWQAACRSSTGVACCVPSLSSRANKIISGLLLQFLALESWVMSFEKRLTV